jgi:hypothetical protein
MIINKSYTVAFSTFLGRGWANVVLRIAEGNRSIYPPPPPDDIKSICQLYVYAAYIGKGVSAHAAYILRRDK